jgi:hypothetical protein
MPYSDMFDKLNKCPVYEIINLLWYEDLQNEVGAECCSATRSLCRCRAGAEVNASFMQ